MHCTWRILGLGVSVAALVAGLSSALADSEIGNVVQKQFNGATGTRTSSTSFEDLVFTHEVYGGEKVTTPAQGSTVMRFRDQTQLQIGANSAVILDRFVYDPGSNSANGSIKFAKGIFRYIGGQAKDEQSIQLSTPTTTLTIRGTKFLVFVDNDGTTTVGVIEGAVDVKPCGGSDVAHPKAGQAVKVTPSCSVLQVALTSLPSDPATDGDYSVSEGFQGNDSGGDTGPTGGGSPPSGGGFGKGHGPGGGGGSGGIQ